MAAEKDRGKWVFNVVERVQRAGGETEVAPIVSLVDERTFEQQAV
jgi:hypothetical protein